MLLESGIEKGIVLRIVFNVDVVALLLENADDPQFVGSLIYLLKYQLKSSKKKIKDIICLGKI